MSMYIAKDPHLQWAPPQYEWQCRKGGKCPDHMLSQGTLGEG